MTRASIGHIGPEIEMIATVVELVLALCCIGIAGHILMRLWDSQRHAARKDK